MDYYESINKHMEKSGGIITSEYCRKNNIPTVYLSRLTRKNELEKVGRGIYITKYGDYDELYFYQHRYKKIIFSYETALFLLGIGESFMGDIEVSIPQGYKFNEYQPGVNIHYVKKSIYELGVVEAETMFGNKVKIYCYERIICDFIKNESKVDREVFIKTIKKYKDYKNKDLQLLYKIAKIMGIAGKLRNIMEVVL